MAMREILFRGFHPDENGKEKVFVNGEWVKGMWVKGYYYNAIDSVKLQINKTVEKRYYIAREYTYEQHPYGALSPTYLVIPETVGQFIGWLDKKGNKVFEGDILEACYDKEHPTNTYRSLVMQKECAWGIYNEIYDEFDVLDSFQQDYNVFIGNIHSNPELLEGKE